MLAFQVSILATVFGFGLKATSADLQFLARRPGLRSLLAVFVIMPLIAVALVRFFDLRPVVKITLVAPAISAVPLYLLLNVVVGIPYIVFQRRQTPGTVSPA